MLYYLGISIAEFGGDDGMRLEARAASSRLVDLNDPVQFYYLALGVHAAVPCILVAQAREFAVRHGVARLQVERGALARHRLLALSRTASPPSSSPARCAASPARCYAQPHQLHHARPDELARSRAS